jgi:hypothetical protein
VFRHLIIGNVRSGDPIIYFFERKNGTILVPYIIVVLIIKNLIYQYHLPFCSEDLKLQGKLINLPDFKEVLKNINST